MFSVRLIYASTPWKFTIIWLPKKWSPEKNYLSKINRKNIPVGFVIHHATSLCCTSLQQWLTAWIVWFRFVVKCSTFFETRFSQFPGGLTQHGRTARGKYFRVWSPRYMPISWHLHSVLALHLSQLTSVSLHIRLDPPFSYTTFFVFIIVVDL